MDLDRKDARCLILACGNTVRGDDGVGPWLADWAEERFRALPGVHVIARQQWTPELAEDIACAEHVLFIDCSIASEPGSVSLTPVEPFASNEGLATHHQSPAGLLQLAHDLYDCQPHDAQLLAIGAGSTELGEQFSEPVLKAILAACALLERTIVQTLREVD